MEEQFQAYVSLTKLWGDDSKVLVAVSGGVDSIVLVQLLKNTGVTFSIAHCNFDLRGKESDEDEVFVRSLAEQYGVEFYTHKFDTKVYAREHKISVQMAARDLRYEWFDQICLDYGLDFLATAHHNDDNVETFFLNLIRGTGLRGLTGMNPRTGNIIRPLLFASKAQIKAYARERSLEFREDSSNASDAYERNNIRHNIIPELVKLNPRFAEAMRDTMDKLSFSETAYLDYLKEVKAKIIEEGDTVKISIEGLVEQQFINHLLFELIAPYGFSGSDVSDIVRAIHGESGKQFLSKTHRLVKDRDYLIIDPITTLDKEDRSISIDEDTTSISRPINLTFKLKSGIDIVIPSSDGMACLDRAKLKFPLKLRKWVKGDYMYPLGMNGRKKLSDIFIDKKIPLNEKENIFVLESDGEIAWVVGHKIDDRFKTTEATEQVCLIELC